MCGIVGIYRRGEKPLPSVDLRRSVELMHHRGPDENGFWSCRDAHLAMARLAIIEPQGNHQPACSQDGQVQVVFNGQIYNHRELRRELIGLGSSFTHSGDSEVIVHAYLQWGDVFLERLNGMFAIAIYDQRATPGKLLLARDRLGIKPLYYHLDDNQVVFGSEVKVLLPLLEDVPAANIDGMLSFLTFEYINSPHTLFEGVQKLRPGRCLTVVGKQVKERQYWSPPTETVGMSVGEAEESLYELLSDAVRVRLMSDVPLGAFLSGGVDSSILVALMSQHLDQPARTFSVSFGDSSYDESSYARLVADHWKTDHTEIRLNVNHSEFDELIDLTLDDPIGDFSIFSTWLVSRAARQHVTVALSGDGGDELFGGYDTYLADKLASAYRYLGPAITQRLLPRVMRMAPPLAKKKGLLNRAKVFVEGAALPADLGHARWMTFLDARKRGELFTPEFSEHIGDRDPTDHIRRIRDLASFTNSSARNMFVDTCFYLPENILHKVDRASMAASLETRVPFLDHRVVELALSMPPEFRVARLKRKAILKRTFRNDLPPEIRRRGKEGFSTPMKHWLKNELRPLLLETLSDDRLRRDGIFAPDTVRNLIEQHLVGKANHSHLLWSLVLYNLWLDRYQPSHACPVVEKDATSGSGWQV